MIEFQINFYSYLFRYSASNRCGREETVTIADKDVNVDGVISFRGDDDLMYRLLYVFDNNGYNTTIESYPFRRIPPGALKSLIG